MGNTLELVKGKLFSIAATTDREEVKRTALHTRKLVMAATLVAMAAMMLCGSVFAAGGGSAGEQAIEAVLKIVFIITNALGILFIIVGLVRLVISWSQEDSPGQQRAAMFIAVGLALLVLKPVLNGIGFKSWIDTSFS